MHNWVYVRGERVIVKDIWLAKNNWLYGLYQINRSRVVVSIHQTELATVMQ